MTIKGKPDCNLKSGSLIKMFEESFRSHWNLTALMDYNGSSYKYSDVAIQIAKLHIMFRTAGIKRGDKIALCGKNFSNWGISYLAILTYGAVAVPILNDFKPDNIHLIVNHSETRLLFVGDQVWAGLQAGQMTEIMGVVLMDDFSLSYSRNELLTSAMESMEKEFENSYPDGYTSSMIEYAKEDDMNSMAVLSYTSGTTSNPKGVMIPYRSLLLNMKFACTNIPLQHNHKVVSILPMAHMFGLTFQLMFELLLGSCVCYLVRTPSPKIIFGAFGEVKPKIVIAVPLIIEKIIKGKIFPLLEKKRLKVLIHLPFVRQFVYKSIRKKLIDAFGGEMAVLIIGGAPLNYEVERFLKQIRFPYTVGYGATECGPLIAYADWEEFKLGTCGKAVTGTEVLIEQRDSEHKVGEIKVRGDNVMLGYYKAQRETDKVLDTEGWYFTGDMGLIDKSGNLTIKGRCKTMILGPSGQNIYPEELEEYYDNMPYVVESLVVSRAGKLVVLLLADCQAAEAAGISEDKLKEKLEANRIQLNRQLPNYSQISCIEYRYEPFERTPKRSIRRFLYK